MQRNDNNCVRLVKPREHFFFNIFLLCFVFQFFFKAESQLPGQDFTVISEIRLWVFMSQMSKEVYLEK